MERFRWRVVHSICSTSNVAAATKQCRYQHLSHRGCCAQLRWFDLRLAQACIGDSSWYHLCRALPDLFTPQNAWGVTAFTYSAHFTAYGRPAGGDRADSTVPANQERNVTKAGHMLQAILENR
jgi:hypothetical protein